MIKWSEKTVCAEKLILTMTKKKIAKNILSSWTARPDCAENLILAKNKLTYCNDNVFFIYRLKDKTDYRRIGLYMFIDGGKMRRVMLNDKSIYRYLITGLVVTVFDSQITSILDFVRNCLQGQLHQHSVITSEKPERCILKK